MINRIVIGLVLAFSVVGVSVSFARLIGAKKELTASVERRSVVLEEIRLLREIQASTENTLIDSAPRNDFERRFGEVLRSSGVSPDARYSISVGADRGIRRGGIEEVQLREREIVVRMPGLTVAQTGAVLSTFRREMRVWWPTRVEMTHDPRAGNGAYVLELRCTALYRLDGE